MVQIKIPLYHGELEKNWVSSLGANVVFESFLILRQEMFPVQ
jgi:hypothetical protein